MKRKIAMSLVVPAGWTLIPFGASDMTACGCSTHVAFGVPCVPLVWRTHEGRYELQCTECGCTWTRAIPFPRHGNGLHLDMSHPEEQAARQAKRHG